MYERTKEEILQGLSEADFLLTCRLDPSFWAERVFGFDIQPFHKEWISLVRKYDRLAITAPTGFGKTSILGLAYPLWLVTFRTNQQVMIVSDSTPQSMKVLEEIKKTIENNELLQALIPETRDTWTKKEINLSTGGKIFCRPYTKRIKGYHVNYLLLDEAASYSDPSLFFEDVLTRAVTKRGTIAAISTPEDIADLMAQLNKTPGFYCKTYKAINEDGTPLWPSKFPISLLMEIKAQQGEGKFLKNYMCDPRAPAENALFPANVVENCFDENLSFTYHTEGHVIIIGADFAIASGPTADFDAYIVTERIGEKIIIRHGEIHKGFSPAAKVRRLEDLYNAFKPMKMILDPSVIGIGVIADLREKGFAVEAANFSAASRNSMLINLRKLMGDPNQKPPVPSQLIIPRNPESEITMSFTNRLISELLAFQETKTRTGIKTYQSKSRHDDTVFALALACMGASSQRPIYEDEIFSA